MATQQGSSPTLVYTAKTFNHMLAQLKQRPLIGLDTESDSLYSYYPKVCLIQISACSGDDPGNSQTVVDYLVDPLRLADLSALGKLLAAPPVEVIMHAAENDMLLLYRNFGFTFRRVFDTQLAARILGWKQVGLAAILESQFGIVSDKRMQRTNWGKRPLTPQQITYAQMDTHYLPALCERLRTELQARDRWEEALDAFEHLTRTDYSTRQTEERTFWQMKAVRDVTSERVGVLETLWQWREAEARQQNRPPFKVVTDAVLVELARLLPADEASLSNTPGLSGHQVERYGAALLHVIEEGKRRPRPRPPEFDQRPELLLEKAALVRYDALRKWRSEKARLREVTPDIVLTNSTLLTIAQHNPASEAELLAIPDLGRWKVQTYGPEILATMRNLQPRGRDDRLEKRRFP